MIEDRKTEDELFDEAEAALGLRKTEPEPKPEEPKVEPVAEQPNPEQAETEQPKAQEAPKTQEPFAGYSNLPEGVRAHYDKLLAESKERERLAADHVKLQHDLQAMRGRVGPTQQRIAELERQLSQRPAQAQPVDTRGEFAKWIERQSPGARQRYQEFPDEALQAFEISTGVASEQARQQNEYIERRFQELAANNERALLARDHPDFNRYLFIDGKPTTQEAADYGRWLTSQSDEVHRLSNSNTASDISEVLSLYKWGRDNPGLQQEMQSQEFLSFVNRLPPAFAGALNSPRVADRQYIIQMFLGELDRVDPKKAEAVGKIASHRSQQQAPSPSIRSTVAPVKPAATASGDADFDQAEAMVRQHLSRST